MRGLPHLSTIFAIFCLWIPDFLFSLYWRTPPSRNFPQSGIPVPLTLKGFKDKF